MFYVESFFQLFKNKPFKTIIVAILGVFFICSFIFHQKINKHLSSFFSVSSNKKAYFNFIIDKNQNYNSVIRKLRNLPGVELVNVEKTELLNKKISKLNLTVVTKNNYIGVRVLFQKGLQIKSIQLVVNYLKHLVVKEYIVLGRIHDFKKIKSSKINIYFVSWIISGVLFLLFLVFFQSWSKDLTQYSYIIEQYQNLSFVNFKISMVFISMISIFVCSLSYFFQIASFVFLAVGIILLYFPTVLFSFKKSWQY